MADKSKGIDAAKERRATEIARELHVEDDLDDYLDAEKLAARMRVCVVLVDKKARERRERKWWFRLWRKIWKGAPHE